MISIVQVLREIGVDVVDGQYPQQIHCPFHGGGQELHMSARVYPQSNSWYCFTESKAFTAVTTLATAYDISISQAMHSLRERFGTVETKSPSKNEKILPRVADLISCLTLDDLLSDEIDTFLSNVARGYSSSTLETQLRDILRKRWPRLV